MIKPERIAALNLTYLKRIASEVEKAFPISTEDATIQLDKIDIPTLEELGNTLNGIDGIYTSKIEGTSITVPVKGTLSYIDSSGQKTSKHLILFKAPIMTAKGSFVLEGNEVTIPMQMRLRAGVYAHIAPNGTYVSRFFLSKGKNFRIEYDPISTTMKIVAGKTVPVIPLLIGLGIPESRLKSSLGNTLYTQLNDNIPPEQAVSKFASMIGAPKDKPIDAYLKEDTEVETRTVQTTLGLNDITYVKPEVIEAAMYKLLALAKGEAEEDHTDDLIFKKVYDFKDLVAEAVSRTIKYVANTLKYKIKIHKDPDKVLSSGLFSPNVKNFFVSGSLAQFEDSSNPLAVASNLTKITLTGEGGLANQRAAKDSDRGLNPTHLAFIDPVHTPESDKIGLTLHMGTGAFKVGDTLGTTAWDVKQNKMKIITPFDTYNATVAFPGQSHIENKVLTWKVKKIQAQQNKQIKLVSPEEVDYVLVNSKNMYGPATNSLPYLSAMQGNRAMMAAKHQEQAIALDHPETPLVTPSDEEDIKYDVNKEIAEYLSLKSPTAGIVTEVSNTEAVIKDSGGTLHTVKFSKNVPINDSQAVSFIPIVKVGDKVIQSQTIARNNYTKDGKLALGTNLRVAYVPYRGMNFEDAIVVSEKGAEKMSSSHVYTIVIEPKREDISNLSKFRSVYPYDVPQQKATSLNDKGVIKKGSKVQEGDPLYVALRPVDKEKARAFNKIFQQVLPPYTSQIHSWDHQSPGEVVSVVATNSRIVIQVKTVELLKVGDKIVGRHGNKGTVSKIIPDAEAPQDESGNSIELMLNPMGIPSRINPSQLLETLAGKIADKTGKQEKAPQFTSKDYMEDLQNRAGLLGIKEKEKLYDPVNKRYLENAVVTGKQYIVKLKHQSEHKLNVRDSQGYDQDMQPLKGSNPGGGARAIDPLTIYGLLAHDARNVLAEMATYKSEKNADLWNAIKTGAPLPIPKTTYAFSKFGKYLNAAGIKMEKKGDNISLFPMTNHEVVEQSSGEIKFPTALAGHNLKPEKGGLYDPTIFGGIEGDKWGHISLAEPVMNPMYPQYVSIITGIPRSKLLQIQDSTLWVSSGGELSVIPKEGFTTGGKALQNLLGKVDMSLLQKDFNTKLEDTDDIQKIDSIAKKARVVNAMLANKIKIKDLVVTEVPVLPPKHRPIYKNDEGQIRTSGLNSLYKDLIIINNQLKEDKDDLPEDIQKLLQKDLRRSLEALYGTSDPLNVSKGETPPEGILRIVGSTPGKQPKASYYQSKVVKKRQELSGTAVIEPDTHLHMDEVGVPIEAAWSLYKPFILKRLIAGGLNTHDAAEEIDRRSHQANEILMKEIKERPVILNRPPSLHKFSTMAFKPKLVDGNVLKLHPMSVTGFNADFDGDTMAIHVPVTDSAVSDANSMFPSKNWFRPGNSKFMQPFTMEYVAGIYQLSKNEPSGTPVKYDSLLAVEADWKSGKLLSDSAVNLSGKVSSAGRHLVNGYVPDKYKNYKESWDSARINGTLAQIAKNDPDQVAALIDTWKDLSSEAAYLIGVTASLGDLQEIQKKLAGPTRKKLEALENPRMSDAKRIEGLFQTAKNADDSLKAEAKRLINNGFADMLVSGAKGSIGQIRQMGIAPIAVYDHNNNPVQMPLKRGYAEGTNPGGYFSSLYGARRGMIARKMATAEPGALTKEIISSTMTEVITSEDNDQDPGFMTDIGDSNLVNRFLAKPIIVNKKEIASTGQQITPKLIAKLKEYKIEEIPIKSPLSDPSKMGLSAKAFGIDETGHLPSIGTNIGIKSTQAVTEILSQSTMDQFHTGASISETGKHKKLGYSGVQALLRLPQVSREYAVLSDKYGVVTNVRRAQGGGFEVAINGSPYKVPFVPGIKNPVIVNKGDTVRRGQPLNLGIVNPRYVMALRGSLPEVQKIMKDQLTVYLSEMGITTDSATLETIVRSFTTKTIIKKPSKSDEGKLYPGQQANSLVIDNQNRKSAKQMPVDASLIGYRVAKKYKTVHPGTIITLDILKELQAARITMVEAYKDTTKHQPMLYGSDSGPLKQQDWMARMNFRRLREALPEAAVTGMSSNIHGTNPLNAYAYGAEFGKNKTTKKNKGYY